MALNGGKSTAIDHSNPVGVADKTSSEHSAPGVVAASDMKPSPGRPAPEPALEETHQRWFAYLRTRNFWIVLGLGQVLALCITGTNTFSSLLAEQPFSIPAFQTFWNYVLLNVIYSSYTVYKYGFGDYFRIVLMQNGWKYLILSFLDVEGNYFTVLAYRYTTILSAQLINFWAIVIVVIVSFVLLRVRYHWTQIVGILICIGGVGILFGSDHVTQGSTTGGISRGNQLKGDLFALAGATFYGLSNVTEEFLVSKRPLYEVVGQLGFWGMLISGTQTGIFDRDGFHTANWHDGKVGGYLVGYTLCLTIFYSGAPLMFRLASAAFFNISLLTGNFWGVCIGVKVFHLDIHWMYPIAFVCIIGGLIVYFVGKKALGEARKPWLGANQEEGVSGIGTARRRFERPDAIV
ncbi:uncharacterized protein KY384_000488 [Bacidia gigantensis]|uniref:uncharacterized protein n=1 Tax=Bacidia gigantensis TaxID=2732470 RepID=UPI001D0585F2|nr:uncharacterized protein KY384_000488 [Bacidia gigantensis]KAG8525728.1 hypothetical protein KY384_000488 [Bacidia gigantensis]